ncbi:adenylate kinase 1 [Anaeramoeba flamelloides]|uniref:Adenylate kinase 1 n=1 Tax=Anaeramoeba flamelloides TaxID=1746091 RepID=A0AAV7YA90_9EUKA|nr:adenylate kinase 1 isoform b [Anaeramoeba flamelloides]KAJ6236738.1 adenylate kinase 1 [Anaeramoeba flamelloides]
MGEFDRAHVIFVLGPAGVGKGTMCSLLQKEFNFVHLSAGALLRKAVEEQYEKGEMIAQMMKDGIIVPKEITIGLLKKEIRYYLENTDRNTFLVDGFPRMIDQGEMFEEVITPCDFVLFLHADDEELLKRLRKRAENTNRIDDNEESFQKRFQIYKELCYPVIENFGKVNKVKKVILNSAIEENYQKVREIFLED